LRARDGGKDQSYVLHMLGPDELAWARFPIGEHTKARVREIAAALGLRTAAKPESQEICFVPDGKVHAFLSRVVPDGSRPGPILDADGRRLGTHRGFAHYTVGQRRGLGVGAGVPLYVREVRPGDNAVVVVPSEGLGVWELELTDVSFVAGEAPDRFQASVMTRYRGPEAPATIERYGQGWRVTFDELQRPSAPGQAAVFYREEEVLGGGRIVCSS
ncbi:MAG: tRNA methyl transferase PRC-barrel domain-containing protein, partial [Actinomycetota bacterium]